METKTDRTSNTIGNILQVTKSTIQQTQNYYNYYINKDNDLYRKQLPLLIHKYNLQALAIKRKEIEKNVTEVGITPYTKNEDKIFLTPLNSIRNAQIRSKKLPPLCPFYNKKGELVPSVVTTSKIHNNLNNLDNLNLNNSFESNSLGKIRLNRSPKIDSLPGLTNVEINFDDFQKDYFYEPEYFSLEYQDCEIFGKKDYYLELIKNKINEFKTMEMNNVNLESMKGKLFDRNKKTNISLKFDSIIVKIYETQEEKIEDENESEVQTIKRDVQVFEYNLPFFFLPLFYLKGEEKFKIFLSKIILWDNVNKKFTLCENPEKDFIDILKNCADFNKEEKKEEEKKEEKPEEPQPRTTKSKYSLTMGKKSFKSQFAGFKFGGLNNTIAEEQNLAQTMAGPNPGMYLTTLEERQKKLDIVFQSSIYPNKKEYNYINYNIFEFLWITDSKNFKVCINTPLITVNIPSNNIQVKKYIDFELLFYLYENDFKNWDFYLIKYLSSYKSFRALLEQINSVNECANKSFYLTQPRVKNYLFNNTKIINIATVKYRDVLKNLMEGLMGIPEENDVAEDKKKDDKSKTENKNDKKEEPKGAPKEEIKETKKEEKKIEEKKEEINNEIESENKDANEEKKDTQENVNYEEENKETPKNENNNEENKENANNGEEKKEPAPQENENNVEETKKEEEKKNEEQEKEEGKEQKEENKEEIKKENHEDNGETKEKEEEKKDEITVAQNEDEFINSTLVQKCFIAIVRFVDTKTFKAHEYKIYFNFSQLQKFQKMERYIDKISFLIKFININHLKKKVTMDYKALDSFDEDEWIKDFNKYNVNYLETVDSVTNGTFEYRRTSAEYAGMVKNSVIQVEIYTPLSLARILNESGVIKTEKVFLNNNYQDDIMCVEKDNILHLSKIFYDCYEEEQNSKK